MSKPRMDAKPLEDFAMWAMLQPGGQKGNVQGLKSFVHDWITMATQKNAGQRNGSKGIPWEAGSKAVSWDNLERVKMGILCEAVALVLSGKLNNIPEWVCVDDETPNYDGKFLCYYHFRNECMCFVGCLDFYATDEKPHWQHEKTGLTVSHWMPLPPPPEANHE